MRNLLVVLFVWVLFFWRGVLAFPQFFDIARSITLLIIVFIIIEHTKSDLYILLLLLVFPNLFENIILLITPAEPSLKSLSITSTIAVMIGAFYDKIPIKWNY